MPSPDEIAGLQSAERPVLIGLGAIGSWAARWLTAHGITFHGYDDDHVSIKNLAAGAFETADIGRAKAGVFSAHARRWTSGGTNSGTAILVCADHGQTRRDAAQRAWSANIPLICAKANGNLWQVWHVKAGDDPADFIAFDIAAEQNPVTVPCGDPSVGRVASVNAAAELLTAWAGFDITAADVENSFGVEYDPALQFFVQAQWNAGRADAETIAHEMAAKAFADAIDAERTARDGAAMQQLAELRAERAQRRKKNRLTLHQKSVYLLDIGGYTAQSAAQKTIGGPKLAQLVAAESAAAARVLNRELALPETITIEEIPA